MFRLRVIESSSYFEAPVVAPFGYYVKIKISYVCSNGELCLRVTRSPIRVNIGLPKGTRQITAQSEVVRDARGVSASVCW